MSDFDAALASLPHGPEFRFVDALLELEPGKSAAGSYTLRGDEAFLAGHFPGQPIFPAVLLVEAIAQVAGVAAQSDPERGALPNLRLAAIRNAKVMQAVAPGAVLRITAEVTGRLGNMILAAGRITLDGSPVAEAQVTLAGG